MGSVRDRRTGRRRPDRAAWAGLLGDGDDARRARAGDSGRVARRRRPDADRRGNEHPGRRGDPGRVSPPWLQRPRDARRPDGLLVAVVAVLSVAGARAGGCSRHPRGPQPASGAARVVFVIGGGALALLAWRAGRTYVLTRRVSDLLVTVGLVWLIAGQYGLLHYGMIDAGWWAAHALEVAGIGLVGIPAALDVRYAVASRPLVGDLRPVDLVAHEEAFLGGRVRALLTRLALPRIRQPRTIRARVATLAVQIGEELGLSERRLRLLPLGGLLHDMGKLAVPDDILKKPAKLSDDEFAVIDTIRRGVASFSRSSAASRRSSCDSWRAITSASTPTAIPTSGPRATSSSRSASSRSRTSSTPLPTTASTGRPGRRRAPWNCSRETGSAFDSRCVRALHAC